MLFIRGDAHRKLRFAATVLAAVVLVGCPKKPVVPKPPPTATLTANPISIQRGHSSTLTWETQNATEITIDPIGKVAAQGSTPVSPLQTTTYQLTANGPGGTAHATATITVTEH